MMTLANGIVVIKPMIAWPKKESNKCDQNSKELYTIISAITLEVYRSILACQTSKGGLG